MFWSGGQSSESGTPSVKITSKFGTHLSTHCRDERLSRPYPSRDLNLGPVVWITVHCHSPTALRLQAFITFTSYRRLIISQNQKTSPNQKHVTKC
ncbi:hypothetical protein TNCV_5017361 [Trichonephila clavipes]|nr:hypothetical protein TNCV_5017361 [Trichonephila clavipes]